MKYIRIINKQLFIKFKSENIKERVLYNQMIQSLRGCIYNKKYKGYFVRKCEQNIKLLIEYGFNVQNVVQRNVCIPNNIPLFDYQIDGVKFIYNNYGSILLADDMGIGKSIQAITYMMILNKYPVLIMCPASLKLNWQNEIYKWIKKNSYVVSGRKDYNWSNERIIIINYDIIKDYESVLVYAKFPLLIADECHIANNINSYRGKAFVNIAKNCGCVLGLSGTPIQNNIIEFYNLLSVLRPKLFNSWWDYVNTYCNYSKVGKTIKYNGSKNYKKLHHILNNNIMLRRLKHDVLKELPEKLISVIPVEITNRNKYEFVNDNFYDWLKKGDKDTKKITVIFAKIEKLKQIIMEGKEEIIYSWIDNFITTGKKLVIMCRHTKVINNLMLRYNDIAVKYDGRDSKEKKQKAEDLFYNKKKIQLFIGNMKAAGVGLNKLVVASTLLILELGWNPGEHNQAIDRVHRIGQNDCCNIYYFIAQNTIEEDIIELLDKKQRMLDGVLDGKQTVEENLLSSLLDKIKLRDK